MLLRPFLLVAPIGSRAQLGDVLRGAGVRIPVAPVFQEVEAVLHHRGYVMLRGAGVQIPCTCVPGSGGDSPFVGAPTVCVVVVWKVLNVTIGSIPIGATLVEVCFYDFFFSSAKRASDFSRRV